jgi:hypothetical protein
MPIRFTAPTIHSAFDGKITLEMINLSQNGIMLVPDVYICQLILNVSPTSPRVRQTNLLVSASRLEADNSYCAVIATAFAPTHS